MRWPLVAILLLSGCSGAPAGGPTDVILGCPDIEGATFDCAAPPLELAIMDEAPDLDDGWGCAIDHSDEAPREFFKLYRHVDGRLGYHWRWPVPDWSHRFVALTLVEPGGNAWAMTEHRLEGFAEFPKAPDGQEGVAAVAVHALRLDEHVDGAWRPIDGARLDIGTRDGVGYFVWSWIDDGEPVHLDINVPSDSRVWTPQDTLADINGRMVSAAVDTSASTFEAQYWGYDRFVNTDCRDDTLPGGPA